MKNYIDELSDKLFHLNKFTCWKEDGENKITISAMGAGLYKIKTVTLPKTKKINIDWLINKCNAMLNTSDYNNLKSIFENLQINGNIYYTSFGFSFDCLFKNEEKINESTTPIKEKLDALGINYTTEYSEAHWVYRFKISKSKETINLINSLSTI